RDLSSAVGGLSTLAALRRLDADPTVEVIVVVSKPPDDAAATAIEQAVAGLATQVVIAPLGSGRPDLTSTAERVTTSLGAAWSEPPSWGVPRPTGRHGYVRGLFSGGTLCDEAMLVALPKLGRIASNIALAGQPELSESLDADRHTFIDFGDDRLTVGRPHPMI